MWLQREYSVVVYLVIFSYSHNRKLCHNRICKTYQSYDNQSVKISAIIILTATSQWARWRIKSLASWLFTQTFVQTQVKKNIRAHRWPVNSPHKGPVTRKMFPFDECQINLCLPRQNGRHFEMKFCKHIFLIDNIYTFIWISLKCQHLLR